MTEAQQACAALKVEISAKFSRSSEATLTDGPGSLGFEYEICVPDFVPSGKRSGEASMQDALQSLRAKILAKIPKRDAVIWWKDGPEVDQFPEGWKGYTRFCIVEGE